MADEGGDEEDERREAALASAPIFQSNFKSSKFTQSQIDKFKDLHKRRLQIKQITKDKEKFKGDKRQCTKVDKEDPVDKATTGTCASNTKEDSIFCNAGRKGSSDEGDSASKKRRKLHWGLDAKERWERKANM